jgi:hypothetical protein
VAVVTCGEGSGVGQPSFSGVIEVAGDGVAAHGAHGISTTCTPASGEPLASSTTVPDALVTAGVVEGVGAFIAGGCAPPPPPPQAASAATIPMVLAIARTFMVPTPPIVPR